MSWHSFQPTAAWAPSWRLLTKELEKAKKRLESQEDALKCRNSTLPLAAERITLLTPGLERAPSAHRSQTPEQLRDSRGASLPTPPSRGSFSWRSHRVCVPVAFQKLLILSRCLAALRVRKPQANPELLPGVSSPLISTVCKKPSILENPQSGELKHPPCAERK